MNKKNVRDFIRNEVAKQVNIRIREEQEGGGPQSIDIEKSYTEDWIEAIIRFLEKYHD